MPTSNAGQGGTMELVFMLVTFGLIFYFMIIRPQSKRNAEHKKMMEDLKVGTEVLTHGGIIGSVKKMKEKNSYVVISISENTDLTIKKDYITTILPKGSMQSIAKWGIKID